MRDFCYSYLVVYLWGFAVLQQSKDCSTDVDMIYSLISCCVCSILLSTQDAGEGSSPCPPVSQCCRVAMPCASFCSRVLDRQGTGRERHEPEAAVTSGQEGQRELAHKKLEGFMESLWEAWNGTVCFGSLHTKSEGWEAGWDKAAERQAGSDLRTLHELDLYLVVYVPYSLPFQPGKESHQGVLSRVRMWSEFRKWGTGMAAKLDDGYTGPSWQYGLGRMEGLGGHLMQVVWDEHPLP